MNGACHPSKYERVPAGLGSKQHGALAAVVCHVQLKKGRAHCMAKREQQRAATEHNKGL
jgi:hypothetical protein